MTQSESAIIAAGAVVWRKGIDGVIEVAIIHRPRYDDWSLPKGKQEPGESLISCAFREIYEETGLRVTMGPFLGEVAYFLPEGLKKVSYWSARAHPSTWEFVPNEEVDQLLWVSTDVAAEKLTRQSDTEIIQKFSTLDCNTFPLILLRHAKALARQDWHGDDDEDRPLDVMGQLQAKRLSTHFSMFGIEEIHSSDALRCYTTVQEMADSFNQKVNVSSALSEYSFKRDKKAAIEYVKSLRKLERSILICGHNPILPKILEKLLKKYEAKLVDQKLHPADAWIVHRAGKRVIGVEYISAPVVTPSSNPST